MKNKQLIDTIISNIKKATERDTIRIYYKEATNIQLIDSKIGGYPYIKGDVPKDKDGNDMFCLAQLNLSELPNNNIYPRKGLLQFWISRDDIYGIDFDDATNSSGHRVIYYQDIDESITLSDVKEIYQFSDETDEYLPIYEKPFKDRAISFELTKESINTTCYEYEELIVEYYNKYVDEKIEKSYDLSDEISEYIWEELDSSGHKIGGHPYFTQNDVREYNKEYRILLLQIDSDDDFDMMWGDSGICNFFITKEQLEKKDFSRVLYNWDCC